MGHTVFIGGAFRSIGGKPRQNIAALDVSTGTITDWNPGMDGGAHAMAIGGNTLYVGGYIRTIGGQARGNLAALDAFLLDFRVMPFDETAAREAGRVRAALEKKGQRIGAMDSLIAAHAKSLGLPIVTNNVADFSRSISAPTYQAPCVVRRNRVVILPAK